MMVGPTSYFLYLFLSNLQNTIYAKGFEEEDKNVENGITRKKGKYIHVNFDLF